MTESMDGYAKSTEISVRTPAEFEKWFVVASYLEDDLAAKIFGSDEVQRLALSVRPSVARGLSLHIGPDVLWCEHSQRCAYRADVLQALTVLRARIRGFFPR
jgi:hypothetical protein